MDRSVGIGGHLQRGDGELVRALPPWDLAGAEGRRCPCPTPVPTPPGWRGSSAINGYRMPRKLTAEVVEFRHTYLLSFLEDLISYNTGKGLGSAIC